MSGDEIRAAIPVGVAGQTAAERATVKVVRHEDIIPPPERSYGPLERARTKERSERAKESWRKRRQRAHPLPDRHATGNLTVAEALELARLLDQFPVLRKVLL